MFQKHYALFIMLLPAWLLLCTACNPILMKLAGVQEINSFDPLRYEKHLQQMLDRYEGPQAHFVLQDVAIPRYATLFDSILLNHAFQPLQMLFFDKGRLSSYQVNCMAKSSIFFNIDWNFNQRFDTYMPQSAVNIHHETWNLESLLKKIEIKQDISFYGHSEVVVLFWSTAFAKIAKNSQAFLADYLQRHTDASHRPLLLYLNTDAFFVQAYQQEDGRAWMKANLRPEELAKFNRRATNRNP